MMVKLTQIPDLEKLWNLISNSNETIFAEPSDGNYLNLTNDPTAYSYLEKAAQSNQKVKIHLFNVKDYLAIANYLVGAAY